MVPDLPIIGCPPLRYSFNFHGSPVALGGVISFHVEFKQCINMYLHLTQTMIVLFVN